MNKFFLKYDMFVGGLNIATAFYQLKLRNYGLAFASLIIGVACTAIGSYHTEVVDRTKTKGDTNVP